jgi:hypothetical protein
MGLVISLASLGGQQDVKANVINAFFCPLLDDTIAGTNDSDKRKHHPADLA